MKRMLLSIAIFIVPALAGADSLSSSSQLNSTGQTSELTLRQLAEQGDARSQFRLAKIYFNRAFRETDDELALEVVELLERAVEQEHGESQTFLGYLHMAGLLVPKSRSRAIYLWKRAARQGVALAQFNLGVYHATKRTRADDRRAMQWYRKAYRSGLELAAQNIAYMQSQGRAGGVRERVVVNSSEEVGYDSGLEVNRTSIKKEPVEVDAKEKDIPLSGKSPPSEFQALVRANMPKQDGQVDTFLQVEVMPAAHEALSTLDVIKQNQVPAERFNGGVIIGGRANSPSAPPTRTYTTFIDGRRAGFASNQ